MAMVTLDELIRSVQQDAPTPLEQLQSASETAAALGELGDSLLAHFVDRCRRSGHTWAEIGEHLGVTRQAAQKRFVPSIGEVTFERFTARARAALEQAREVATSLGHAYLGTEHLLLAFFQVEGVAVEALTQLGISRQDVEARVLSLTPRGTPESPVGKPGWTPRSAQALADALTEALELGHNYIGTEHLLLGLLRSEKSVAKTVLTELGASSDGVRAVVRKLLAGFLSPQAETPSSKKAAPTKKKAPAKKAAARKKPA